MKRQLIATTILALAVGLWTPVFVHRRDFDEAFLRWRQQPAPENELAMKLEAKNNSAITLRYQIGVGVLVFTALNVIWTVVKRTRTIGAPGSRPFFGR